MEEGRVFNFFSEMYVVQPFQPVHFFLGKYVVQKLAKVCDGDRYLGQVRRKKSYRAKPRQVRHRAGAGPAGQRPGAELPSNLMGVRWQSMAALVHDGQVVQ